MINDVKLKPFKTSIFLIESQNVINFTEDSLESQNTLDIQNRKILPKQFNYDILKTYFEKFVCLSTPPIEINQNNANTNLIASQISKILTQAIEQSCISLSLFESDSLTGSQCCRFMTSYLNYIKSNPTEQLSRDTATFKDTKLVQFRKIKETYNTKCKKLLQNNSSHLSRLALVRHHNNLVMQVFKNMVKKAEIISSPNCHDLLLKSLDTLSTSYNQFFQLNEEKRINFSKEKLKESCEMFTQKLTIDKSSITENTNFYDDLLIAAEQASISNLNSIFGDEPEIFVKDLNTLKKFIADTKISFKKAIDTKISDKTKNAKAVSDSISFYESSMENLFNKNPYLNIVEFRKHKNEKVDEALALFINNCVHGSTEEIKENKMKFIDLLQESNTKYKKQIEEMETQLIAHTNTEVVYACKFYENTLNKHMVSFIDEESLSKHHNKTFIDAINIFKKSCFVNNDEFIDKYLKELKINIEQIFNGMKIKQKEMLRVIDSDYEKEVLLFKNKYVQVMEKLITDFQFLEIVEFTQISEQQIEKTIKEFEEKITIKTATFAEYLNTFKSDLSLKHNELIERNSAIKEKLHEKARDRVKQISDKYEDEMFAAYKLQENKDKLKKLHNINKLIVINELKEMNPFVNIYLINPYLNELDIHVENSFIDFEELFNEILEKRNAETEIILRNVKDTYREEMNKQMIITSFISKESLRRIHDIIVTSIISNYKQNQKHLPAEKKIHNLEYLIDSTLEKQLLLIFDENNKNMSIVPAIGIDLGTTNTVMAYYKPQTQSEPGKDIIIQNEGSNTTPSFVAFTDDGELVGMSAKEHSVIEPHNTVFSVKRLIGRTLNDPKLIEDMNYLPYKIVSDKNKNPSIQVKIKGQVKTYVPEHISAKLLSKMKIVAKEYFNIPIQNAVITVPAYFNDSQKQATKDAAEIAGLNVLDIIPEPVAAALAFKLKNSHIEKRNVLVYDLGGGTFDVAVLVIEGQNIDVKTYSGDNHLGGDDFDRKLTNYCLDEFYKRNSLHANESKRSDGFNRLKIECEKKKHVLSSRKSATIILESFDNNINLVIDLTRELFESLNNELFERTITLLNDALDKAEMTHSDIDDLVLVGGSTKIPKIRQMLTELFPDKQINYTVNGDEAVALGAGVQAAILNGISLQEFGHLKISKIAPMSLGIELKDESMSKIVKQNSKIPIKLTRPYVTANDNQIVVSIIVFEGEAEVAKDNRELGRFELCDIPPAPAGEKMIDVTFDIKDDGILFVTARLKDTENYQEISIVQHRGRLSNEELQKLKILEENQNQRR